MAKVTGHEGTDHVNDHVKRSDRDTSAVRSSLAPPIRKLWPLMAGRPAVFQIEEQKARKKDFVGIE
jgi:hypothetical protein